MDDQPIEWREGDTVDEQATLSIIHELQSHREVRDRTLFGDPVISCVCGAPFTSGLSRPEALSAAFAFDFDRHLIDVWLKIVPYQRKGG